MREPRQAGKGEPARRRRSRWWQALWLVPLGALLCAAAILVLVDFDYKFYCPDTVTYHLPQRYSLACQEVSFATDDGLTLSGWFLPAQGPPRGTVVHFHGNSRNVSGHLSLVAWLPGRGYNLLMFDYRGFGKSEGKPTRAGTTLDGHAAIDYALTRPDVRGRPLFVYGQSLGGAAGIVVAADRAEVDAVVAELTFSDYQGLAAGHIQKRVHLRWLAEAIAVLAIRPGQDPVDAVARIAPRPLFVIVAEKDEICFAELGLELYEAAGEPKELWTVPGITHVGIIRKRPRELIERVTGLFQNAAHP